MALRRGRSDSSSSSSSFASPARPPRRSKPRPSTVKASSSTPSPASRLSSSHILLFLVAYRLLNASIVRTFFQPDEFFQSLEPAWQIAFGENHGAWITWEWKHQLRSSLHPLLFAAVYYTADILARVLHLTPAIRADLLVAAPKTAQAVVAAIGDYYTWKLARRIHGEHSREAWAALALTVLSPWQWFCSTRTLSNCLETTITIVALYLWPWEFSLGSAQQGEVKKARTTRKTSRSRDTEDGPTLLNKLRQCLSLAALACILRPTNILVWVTLAGVAWFRSTWDRRKILAREIVICGPAVLTVSTVVDRLFYGTWTFPPLKFLYFNVAQSLSVFYGKNDWHYYISQGYPLLLITALPFALLGLYRALARTPSSGTESSSLMQSQLALMCVVMPFVLSLISHKEVRFIYPLLPSLHILAAPSLVDYFLPAVSRSSQAYMPRRLTLMFLVLANVVIALYTTIYHASGTLNVLTYLRQQHEVHAPLSESTTGTGASQSGITAGFLMPCHSTPWRSHLVFPDIHAWALSCDPPVGLDEAQKAAYVDEADQFYENPSQFLQKNMVGGLRHVPRKPTYLSNSASQSTRQDTSTSHEWPDYLAFFAALEPTLQSLLRSTSYAECWRTYNTAWHDDWRRRGDIIVWCLDPNEQQAWRTQTRKQQQTHQTQEHHFDRIIEAIKNEALGKPKSSPWQKWKPSIPSLPASWPWQRRKPKTWAGIQIPSLPTTSSWSWKKPSWSWSMPFGKKKAKQISARDLWS